MSRKSENLKARLLLVALILLTVVSVGYGGYQMTQAIQCSSAGGAFISNAWPLPVCLDKAP